MLKLIVFLIFLISYSANLFAFQLSVFSDKNAILLDSDDDEKIDYVFAQKNNELYHYFLINDVESILVTSKINGEFKKELFQKRSNTWKTIRVEKTTKMNELFSKKETTYYYPQKISNSMIIPNTQLRELDIPDAKVWLLMGHGQSEASEAVTLEDQCSRLSQIADFAKLDISSFMKSTFKKIKIIDYINFDGCDDACNGTVGKVTCRDGYEIKCPMDMKEWVEKGLRNKIQCLEKINKELAAQLLGLIFANNIDSKSKDCKGVLPRSKRDRPKCGKIKIKCTNNLGRSDKLLGIATLPSDDNWPSIKLKSIGCIDKTSHRITEFSSTLFHEMFHLIGFAHGENPEIAYACELSCINKRVSKEIKLNISTSKESKDERKDSFKKSQEIAINICKGQDVLEEDDLAIRDMLVEFGREKTYWSTLAVHRLNPEYIAQNASFIFEDFIKTFRDKFNAFGCNQEETISNQNREICFKGFLMRVGASSPPLFSQVVLFTDLEQEFSFGLDSGKHYTKMEDILKSVYGESFGEIKQLRDSMIKGNYTEALKKIKAYDDGNNSTSGLITHMVSFSSMSKKVKAPTDGFSELSMYTTMKEAATLICKTKIDQIDDPKMKEFCTKILSGKVFSSKVK